MTHLVLTCVTGVVAQAVILELTDVDAGRVVKEPVHLLIDVGPVAGPQAITVNPKWPAF